MNYFFNINFTIIKVIGIASKLAINALIYLLKSNISTKSHNPNVWHKNVAIPDNGNNKNFFKVGFTLKLNLQFNKNEILRDIAYAIILLTI